MLRTSENYKFVIDIQHLVILICTYIVYIDSEILKIFINGNLSFTNCNHIGAWVLKIVIVYMGTKDSYSVIIYDTGSFVYIGFLITTQLYYKTCYIN